jgi:hypothetical protein
MPGLLVPVIAVLIIVFGGVALYASRETRAETKKTGKHPKGHYMGLGTERVNDFETVPDCI